VPVPRKKTSSGGASAKVARKTKSARGRTVAVWEDDPGDPVLDPGRTPITVPAPNQAAQPYAFKLGGAAPAPAVYEAETAKFRYWATAAALRRTADFWTSIAPKGVVWQVGKVLPVSLDDGVDLNAFYTRGDFQEPAGLHFFHDTVKGKTYFSCESPDVCCHEMGHAVLDSIRPQLFDAQTIEAAAFHESFGDMSAMLSALQVPTLRQAVIAETSGVLNRSSRLSRLAEQLGAAIRVQHPDLVDRDCLRNAANSFFYHDPQTLPPTAPANALSSEPHSFSRVFTAGFLEALAGMLRLERSSPTPDDLETVSKQIAHILVNAVLTAPVVPDYYSQVAVHMVAASESAPFDGKYKAVIRSAFVRRGVLSLQAATTISHAKLDNLPKAAMTGAKGAPAAALPKASISAANYGLSRGSLMVHTAEEPKRFAVTSAALTLGPVEPRSPQNAAESYTEDLFQRGRVLVGKYAHPDMVRFEKIGFHTHVLVEENGELVLRRRAFECGFDCSRGDWVQCG
jgi:hypothetical protein